MQSTIARRQKCSKLVGNAANIDFRGVTPLNLPYRVWFLRRFGLKTGIDFTYFRLNSGIVFEGMHERICRFMNEKFKEEYSANSRWILKNLFAGVLI